MKAVTDYGLLVDKLKNKLKLNTVKTTTYLTSKTKNSFLNDCLNRGVMESDLAREIIKTHYAILEQNNMKAGKPFCEIIKELKMLK
jgi:hypothetical protein